MFHSKFCLIFCVLVLIHLCLCNSDNEDDNEVENEIDLIIKSTTEQVLESTFQLPDESWTSVALKDIAHYLRNYKFNEWDQRYYKEKPRDNLIGFFSYFPTPTLRTLHWKVYENCESNFYKCISYLHSVIDAAPFTRSDDIASLLNDRLIDNETMIKTLDTECRESRLNSERSSLPFDSPTEKFQWRTTASYYMCWYTMLGTPVLSMLGDTCDNYANCLDPDFGYRNWDPRSDDKLSFACATYSFCPDPCCPTKHIDHLDECLDNANNPCFNRDNSDNFKNHQCTLERKLNRNLKDLINNRWNVSCNCKQNGFKWKSQFGMCIDINECLFERKVCDNQTEDCLNLPGSFKCVCKWNFEFNKKSKKCIESYNSVIYKDESPDNRNKHSNIFSRFLNIFY